MGMKSSYTLTEIAEAFGVLVDAGLLSGNVALMFEIVAKQLVTNDVRAQIQAQLHPILEEE